jgi:hypothetical protein
MLMGYFTWTDARRHPKLLKNGDYAAADKIGYGGYAKVVCPDNTEIIETYYEGYGEFDGHDIYDLVVDWNKDYLEDIFYRMPDDHWGYHLKDLASAFQRDDEYGMRVEIERMIDLGLETKLLREEWKRLIGITISCHDEDNANLPFPIKITTTKWHRRYDELVPSCNCQ